MSGNSEHTLIDDKITLQGQLYGLKLRSKTEKVHEMKDVLEWMIYGLSIWSDGGCVSNLTSRDLTSRQALGKGVG